MTLEKNGLSDISTNNFSWRVPAIDGVRALAMLLVYTFHVWEFAGYPDLFISILGQSINLLGIFRHGYSGVDLFMVLSGFCLFLPLCKSDNVIVKWDVRKYFARRIRRIVPPYYAAILYVVLLPQFLVLLFRLLGQDASWQPVPDLWQFVTHLLFIHTLPFAPFIPTWSGLSGPFWSLGLEAQFYVVFPLVVWGFWKYQSRFIAFMMIISVSYCVIIDLVVVSPQNPVPQLHYHTFFLGRWMQFASGMAAAWIVSQHWKAKRWQKSTLGTFTLLAATALYIFSESGLVASVPLFPLRAVLLSLVFSCVIIALCVTRTPLRVLFENRLMVSLGFISYSVFLIHQPTAWFFSELMKKKMNIEGLPLLFALCSVGFLIVLGCSYVFFLLFERPFLNLDNNQPKSKTTSAALPSQTRIEDQAIL